MGKINLENENKNILIRKNSFVLKKDRGGLFKEEEILIVVNLNSCIQNKHQETFGPKNLAKQTIVFKLLF